MISLDESLKQPLLYFPVWQFGVVNRKYQTRNSVIKREGSDQWDFSDAWQLLKSLGTNVMCKMQIFTLEVISRMNIEFQVFSLPELFKWKNI